MSTYRNVCDDPNPIRKRMHLDLGKALGVWRGGQHATWKHLIELAAKYQRRHGELLDALGVDSFPLPDEVKWDDMIARVQQLTVERDRITDDLRQRATAVHGGQDPLVDRLHKCLKNGASTRGLAYTAYRTIAEMIEQDGGS